MILENQQLRIEIAEHGAELTSLFDLRRSAELLWNGDARFWKRHAPILFPYVGKTWQGRVLINGKRYFPCPHGFARDRDFVLEFSDPESAVFLLRSDDDTRAMYPFDFELRIAYHLTGGDLRVEWNVKNRSSDEMPFTIGGHPAFCFAHPDDKKDDYYLKFTLRDGADALLCSLLDLSTGTATDKLDTIPLQDGCLPLSESLFSRDALIMDGGQIREAGLYRKDGTHLVSVRCSGFPNFGVWSMLNAPFVCLEPWMGRCDDCGFDRELREKPNINLLAPDETFTASYIIAVG